MSQENLIVRFESRKFKMEKASEDSGRPIYEMRDFIHIDVPGDQTFNIDTLVTQYYIDRFPVEWARYKNANQGAHITGTPLEDWTLLSSAQAEEMKHFNFLTIEQVANAPDQAIMNIGMTAGMSPLSLRDKARAYLAHAGDTAAANAQAEELKKRDLEIEQLKATVAQLVERSNRAEDKRGPGRPRKEEQEAA